MDDANAFRKAALLVASLDRDTADQLLDALPPERAQQIRDAVLGLPSIDDEEVRSVMCEFLQDGSLGDSITFAARIARDASSAPTEGARSTVTRPRGEGDLDDGPLERASERLIADCLCGELPQAIAVALSHLPAQRASEVVSYLPAEVQTQVLERLVEFDPASSLEFPEINYDFHQWLNQQIERSLHRAELAARLATILDATHSGTRQRILKNVSCSDARLAKELRHQLHAISPSSLSPPATSDLRHTT